MPKEYTSIRDSLIRRGKPTKTAKRIAAKIYNARHPENANPRRHEKGMPKPDKNGYY